MTVAKTYARRIGAEEAREGRIAVMKSALSLFPAVGVSFQAKFHGGERELRLESYPCTCRGPEKPHEHWFIAWPGLRVGETMTFTPAAGTAFEVTIDG